MTSKATRIVHDLSMFVGARYGTIGPASNDDAASSHGGALVLQLLMEIDLEAALLRHRGTTLPNRPVSVSSLLRAPRNTAFPPAGDD